MATMEAQDVQQLKSTMHSLAFGEAMRAAAENYKKEVKAQERAGEQREQEVDIDDLLDDPELERLHAERLAAMQKEAEKRMKLERTGHGTYMEVQEPDFIEATLSSENVVCHFYHRDFERCKIVDQHLAVLSKKYFDTRFIKISAPDAPFFTVKLQVRMLPCIICFKHGVTTSRMVGFDEVGGTDHFTTGAIEKRLLAAGAIRAPVVAPDSDDEERLQRKVSKSVHAAPLEDEDSDFD